ncbi:hypothetical protein ACL02U_03220 [Streptomyces sp. MS06]|uniref:hypothetical protein n=1 Tax=Streptomyces sp. MS06 TaxID=3385974 RepID=UPI0039A27177
MPTSSDRPPTPATVWPARGRAAGPHPAGTVRRHLRRLKDRGAVHDYLELPGDETTPGRTAFEARWAVADGVTVRSRTEVADRADGQADWLLVAEAERSWDDEWPSPLEMFWPPEPDGGGPHASTAGSRFLVANTLPEDERELRRALRAAGRDSWAIHVVVHEAMTPDERGRAPLTRFLPPGLRHRVVEHRAAPHQLRSVNWALREFAVEVPRGGAVVLPGVPAPPGCDPVDLSVRSVFLDGGEPTELIGTVLRFAALPRRLPEGAEDALEALRGQWHLLTVEEQLVRERGLVAMYAEALEAMTRSRDLYREAAERAHEALAAYREAAGEPQPADSHPPAGPPAPHLTRTLERLRGTVRALRPPALPKGSGDAAGTPASGDVTDEDTGAGEG